MIRPWVVRRACVEKVGPLDEAFVPTEWDEPDFAFRIRRAGWRIGSHAYERDGAFHHVGSYTLAATHRQPWYVEQVVRNAKLFHARWDADIAAHHARPRRTWRRRATAAGWAATAAVALRRLGAKPKA
jgi:GT2 family glycosyltransferase